MRNTLNYVSLNSLKEIFHSVSSPGNHLYGFILAVLLYFQYILNIIEIQWKVHPWNTVLKAFQHF